MKTISKKALIDKLLELKGLGWVKTKREGNAGGVGNTLEDYLGIKENNLPIPNAAEWELKAQGMNTSSLTTLIHFEPSPRALKLVPSFLLINYGWEHKKAGLNYPIDEMSFRQTISAKSFSDRGFKIVIDEIEKKILVSFNSKFVSDKHSDWLQLVHDRIGLNELNPQPYLGFEDLYHKIGSKLINCFYVLADSKIEDGEEYFNYSKILQLESFNIDKFIIALKRGDVYVDFDARTGHNHGTKFRLRQNILPDLYAKIIEI